MPYHIALDCEAQVRVLNESGTIEAAGGRIHFKNANALTLVLAAGTDFVPDRSKGWRTLHHR